MNLETRALVWRELWAALRAHHEAGRPDWVPTTPEMRDAMLGAVPPRCYFPGGFLVGEPWADNADGEPLYAAFRDLAAGRLPDGRRLEARTEARYLTCRQAKTLTR